MTGRPDPGAPWWASDDAGGGPTGEADDPLEAFRRARRAEPGHQHRPDAPDAVCRACPVCTLLRAVQGARPELVTRLADALHHLSLAAKAVLDAQTEGSSDPDDLEHIPVDDE